MFTIFNIILIILICYLLNKIKISNNYKNKSIDTFTNIIPLKVPIYGDIQYNTYNIDNDNNLYKYQNYNDTKLPLTDNLNNINLHNSTNSKSNNSKNSIYTAQYNNIYKQTNLPCEKDIIYDTKFFQPSDIDISIPTNFNKINYTDRKIQDVYNDVVNNVKKDKLNKKLKDKNEYKIKEGAFGENIFNNVIWEYEDEDDGLQYDPSLSNLLVL